MTDAITVLDEQRPVELGVADEVIAGLSGRLTGLDATTPTGYQLVKAGIREVRTMRTDVEKCRKQLKQSALEYGRKVDAEAKRIKSLLFEIEEPLKATKKAVDDEKARIKAEKEAEARRKKEEAERVEREKREAAERAERERIEREQVEQRAKLEAERKRLAEERAELERERAEIQAEKERQEAEQRAREEAERKAEEERLAEECREREAAEKAERERIEAEQKAEEERLAEEQRREEEERAARESEERKPDRQKLAKVGQQILRFLEGLDVEFDTTWGEGVLQVAVNQIVEAADELSDQAE